MDTLGHLLVLTVTSAGPGEWEQFFAPCEEVRQATGQSVQATGQSVQATLTDQLYTSDHPTGNAASHGIELVVVKPAEVDWGFVLPPKRWAVERTFA